MSGRPPPSRRASARRHDGRGRRRGLISTATSSTAWACYLAVALVAAIAYFLNGRSARRVTFEKIRTSPSHTGGKTRPAIKLAICAIVKDEAWYLAEWIEHHKSIGFGSILLYNDRSTDDTQCVLDAYAQRGDVTRIPEDIGSRYMEDAPNNPQQAAIFEACRRYLHDKEVDRGEVSSTWMLTSDIDEFLWFDRALGNAMDTLTTMLSNASPRQLKSIVIPNCVFGPSGKETFGPELLMERFVHRDEYRCERGAKIGSWGMPGKPISQVSSLVIGQKIHPHIHKVGESAESRWSKVMQERIYALQDDEAVGGFMRLAHYKTKSREEFYSRICSSRYYSKYFDPSHGFNKKMMYPGCCSPASYFDYVGDQFIHEDRMMLPFAEDLQSKMSDAAHVCKNQPGKALCPNSVMEMKNMEGLRNIESFFASDIPPKDEDSHAQTGMTSTEGTAQPAIKLAICAIVKDEAWYLAEWIEHHKSIGFGSILLYNDRSTDDTQCVLDAYAQQGDVTRIPEDIGSRHMEDLPWIINASIADNPQAAIFEACRRYLVDQELGRGEVGSTWMLTNDVDEFLWFDRALGNPMDTLTTMLSNASPRQLKSIVIPNCVFGPSGREAFGPEFLMERFVHRDSSIHCESGMKRGSWGMQGKPISQVSSLVIGQKINPHIHKVAESAASRWSKVMQERIYALKDVEAVGGFMRLAHYKTKSREEFYSRICSSRYYSKYFDPSHGFNKKMMYPGCCSPASYFDYVGDQFIHEDRMMLPFAEDLQSKMSDAAHVCKNQPGKALCPNSVMEMKNMEGLRNIESFFASDMVLRKQFQPLVFGAGFGTTATHSMFDATCELRLRSLHFLIHCGYGNDPKLPLPGLLAHLRVVRAYNSLSHCLQSAHDGANVVCPTAKQTMDTMRLHIDKVLESKDVGAIHDTPYPEFAEYIIGAAERIRGTKPIVLLSKRVPRDWAERRLEHKNDLVCKLQMTNEAGHDQYIGQNLYWCLHTAIQKGMGDKSIVEIFHVVKHLDLASNETLYQLVGGMQLYQNRMEGRAQYSVNLFERTPRLSPGQLSLEIDAALKAKHAIPKRVDHLPPSRHTSLNFGQMKRRFCMTSFRKAFVSGRHCDKLVVFLHFHKAGGTSLIDYIRQGTLWYNLRTNSNPERLGELQSPNGTDIASTLGNLRIHSSAKIDASFWDSLYDRGIDFVNLEYNFATPGVHANMSSVYKLTQLRAPWDRFRSTYERELFLRCRGLKGKADEKQCFQNNSLKRWIKNHTGVMTSKRLNYWSGILYPNYYVRMLNGMGDSPPNITLTRDHLETAKRALDSFDTVLILEDDDQVNLEKLWDLLGDYRKMKSKRSGKKIDRLVKIPKLSNNDLKQSPMYQPLREKIDAMRATFEDQNVLDLELYKYVLSKGNHFELGERGGNEVECHISTQKYLELSPPRSSFQRPHSDKTQFMIHIHGWPHTGTGYLRHTIEKSLNNLHLGPSSIQDSTLNSGRYFIEDEGQYLQNVYPRLRLRKQLKIDWQKNYGKLLYLADMCTIEDPTPAVKNQSNAVGELLFDQWSQYWNMSATFLIQKTPTLDVLFLERVKVMPTLHLIIVRHPMTFKYQRMGQKAPNWRPFNWLESWTHVFSALSEGTVDWFAVVSYEALVKYHDQVVEEVMEVVRSGVSRASSNTHDASFAAGRTVSRSKNRLKEGHSDHRRLELHQRSISPLSYLNLTEEVLDEWNRCLNGPRCSATLNSLSLDVLPSLGYAPREEEGTELPASPRTVTVSEGYGHVLFSSEGESLERLRAKQQGIVSHRAIGHLPPQELVTKMKGLLKLEAAL